MLEFLIEDPRARLLTIWTIFCVIAALIYRLVTHVRSLPMQSVISINDLDFKECGPQSPEQYEVYDGDRMVGYVRYRFGNLSAEYPDVGMETVFSHTLARETGQMTDLERGRWLPVIAKRLRKRIREDASKSA